MSNTVTFFHNPMSRGRIVHWMLEETGAPYEIKLLDFNKREQKAPAYLAINPMGKIPAIVHRGTTVTEAAAICTYLADAFPEKRLAPAPDDPLRGTYYRWLFFGAGCVEPAIIDRMLARPAAERPTANGYGTYDDTVATLEKAIAPGPFILGDRFSAADVYLSAELGFGMMTKALEPRASFQSYVGRCTDRPAYKRFLEQTKALEQKLKAGA